MKDKLGRSSKICKACKKRKPISMYHPHKQTKDGRYTECKICHNKRVNKWRKDNPEKAKKHHNAVRNRCKIDPEYHDKIKALNTKTQNKWLETHRDEHNNNRLLSPEQKIANKIKKKMGVILTLQARIDMLETHIKLHKQEILRILKKKEDIQSSPENKN